MTTSSSRAEAEGTRFFRIDLVVRTPHQPSTATTLCRTLPCFHSVRALDIAFNYACALFGRENKAVHDLSPSRYESWYGVRTSRRDTQVSPFRAQAPLSVPDHINLTLPAALSGFRLAHSADPMRRVATPSGQEVQPVGHHYAGGQFSIPDC